MGGMIAQVLGYRRPERVRSLGLIMTGAGKRLASLPRLRALGTLMREAPRERERYAEHIVKVFDAIGSPAFPGQRRADPRPRARRLRPRPQPRRRRAPAARDHHLGRPLAQAARGARRRPSSSTAPTTRWCGRPAGRSVAAAIPDARLVMIPGMGHDLPPEVWPLVAGELVANAGRAAAARAAVLAV